MGLLRVGDDSVPGQVIDGSAYALDHISEGIIVAGPAHHGFAFRRQHLQFREWSAFPIAGTQDDRQHPRFICFVSLNGACHFDTEAEFRGHEVGADEQENNLSGVEVSHDLWTPFGSRNDVAVRPGGENPLAFQIVEMGVQFAAKRLILMSI